MCFGGGGGTMSTPKREFQNRPVTVTGKQTGVDDPKDTKKATEELKIKRQKEEELKRFEDELAEYKKQREKARQAASKKKTTAQIDTIEAKKEEKLKKYEHKTEKRRKYEQERLKNQH